MGAVFAGVHCALRRFDADVLDGVRGDLGADELFDGVEFALAGNQCDLHPNPPYLAMLYSERDRGILAQRGMNKFFLDAQRLFLSGIGP